MSKLYVCGKNSVIDAIKNNFPIEHCYVNSKDAMHEIFSYNKNIKVTILDKIELSKIVNENHQGFIAQIKEIHYVDKNILLKDKPNQVLILDHLHDPHNFGAILRTANAFGIKHIIFPKERSVDVNSTVLKISSGGFIDMKFIKVNSINSIISFLKENNFWIYVSALSKYATPLNKINFNFPMAIVVGNEEKGVSKSTINAADQLVYIPQKGSVQSLNVSVATGVLLYEIAIQDN